MAKTIKTAKGFNNENPFPEQEAAKKAKDVKTPKVKTTTNTSSNSVKLDKKLVKDINKSITKGVKAAKKAAKKSAKKRQTARQKAATAERNKKLKYINDWAREQLKKQGMSSQTSSELRKDYRKYFKGHNVNKMKAKTMKKMMMQYIQARAQTASKITYKQLADLIRHNIVRDPKDANYRNLYYEFTERFGEDVFDADNWEKEVSAEDLMELINKIKDKNRDGKQTAALRKAIRVQVDMKLKNQAGLSDEEVEELSKVTDPGYVPKTAARRRKRAESKAKAHVRANKKKRK